MNTLFIYNPSSGHLQIRQSLWQIIDILTNKYKNLNIYSSKAPKDIFNYLKKYAKNYDLIIVSGGDGTLSEAVNALMKLKDKSKLAYIPTGSTNDYATSLKLSKNIIKCTNQIIQSTDKIKLDIGKFNNIYFVYVAAFGIFTEVSYSTPQDIKNVLGHLAYVLNGIKSVSNIKSYKLKIKVNNNVIEDKFIYGMITNSLSVGGIYQLDKKTVLLDDGYFEILLIKEPKDLVDLSAITSNLINHRNKTDLVITLKTNNIVVESDKPLPWTLDGEYGGSPLKANIKNINKAITLIK